jgi:hypothetical protein
MRKTDLFAPEMERWEAISHLNLPRFSSSDKRRHLPPAIYGSGARPERPHHEVAGEPRHSRDDGRPNHGWNEICEEIAPMAGGHQENRQIALSSAFTTSWPQPTAPSQHETKPQPPLVAQVVAAAVNFSCCVLRPDRRRSYNISRFEHHHRGWHRMVSVGQARSSFPIIRWEVSRGFERSS